MLSAALESFEHGTQMELASDVLHSEPLNSDMSEHVPKTQKTVELLSLLIKGPHFGKIFFLSVLRRVEKVL